MVHWYAVNTKAHSEPLAELNVQRLGVETFYPQMKQRKVIRRKLQTRVGPLFPGYLFARLDVGRHYRAVSYAGGVRKIVACGSAPTVVDDVLIEAIKARTQNRDVIVLPSVFTPGQVVRIEEGPLCGLEAVFEREMADHQRVVLLLRALAYQARVVVPLEQVANI